MIFLYIMNQGPKRFPSVALTSSSLWVILVVQPEKEKKEKKKEKEKIGKEKQTHFKNSDLEIPLISFLGLYS